MNNYFASNLKYLREKNKMSQENLATMLGVELAAISHWENKRREPKMDIVLQIAKIFNVGEEIIFQDLRFKNDNEQKKTVKFGDVEVTLSKNGKITDKDMLELNQFLIKEKILSDDNKSEK